ncbi:hypothetical protein PR261_00500 [Metamycoplasma hyosynoviae]|uniref:hypothetical protein n=2 Tax=Metamycoplasma hyosynoviae TaxID=29559 RepID=UPI002359A7EC|nr:hypothetical protein [Metamycoplasma hyosynoviae]MDC8917530.1 hypothetical protein [Metamycoplasma hyosynoviae]MDC8920376.1 hypothetical protein [Metamycoplasma hyosynoviae]
MNQQNIENLIKKPNKNNDASNQIYDTKIDIVNIGNKPYERIYKNFINTFDEAFDAFFVSKFQNYEKLKAYANEQDEEIRKLRKEIKERRKKDHIGGRIFANALMFILFFTIIGLGLMPAFLANARVIKAFKLYKNETLNQIDNIWNHTKTLIGQEICKFGYAGLVSKFLELYSFKEVKNIKVEELEFIAKLSSQNAKVLPIKFAKKYRFKNTYFYDILLEILEYKIVTTQASRTISYTNSEGNTSYRVITSYHHEPTPFTKLIPFYTMPTNYLPKLNFIHEGYGLTEKEIKIWKKQQKDYLENDEFNRRYKFSYNDIYGLFQYFPALVQENFINLSKILDSENRPKTERFTINKYEKNLYVTNKNNEECDSYLQSGDWIWQTISAQKTLNLDEIRQKIKITIANETRNMMEALTLMFSNSKIANENFGGRQEAYLLDVTIDKEKDDSTNWHYFNLLTNVVGRKAFTFTNWNDSPDKASFITWKNDNYIAGNWIETSVILNGWEAEQATDFYQEVPVPYIRYNEIREPKQILFNVTHLTSNNSEIISSRNNLAVIFFPNPDNDPEIAEVNDLIGKCRIHMNYEATSQYEESKKIINFIYNFYKQFSHLWGAVTIIINQDTFALYLNELDKYDNTEIANYINDNFPTN